MHRGNNHVANIMDRYKRNGRIGGGRQKKKNLAEKNI